MATVSFNLKKPNDKEVTDILMVLFFGKKHITLSTGIRLHPRFWNSKNKINPVRKSDDVSTENLNTRLKNIRSAMLATYNNHVNKHNAVFIDKLKLECKEVLRPSGKESPDGHSLIKKWEDWIKTLDPKSWTTKHYLTVKNNVEIYQKTLPKLLTFEDINMDFYNDYMLFWKTTPYKVVGKDKEKENVYFSLNTMGSHIKEIKALMNYANEKGWTTNMGHRHKNFKVLTEETDSIALTVDEIYSIYNTDLSDDLRDDRIRDLYCIDLWTGLRYQDIQQVSSDKFLDNDTKIKLRTYKTNKTVVIPLHGMIRTIVDKYDGKLPKVPSDQELNRRLKEIGKKAGLLGRVNKTITRAGEKVSRTYYQWELITVHTARRSFATNALRAGIDKQDVKALTGHKKDSTFDKYVKIAQEEIASKLQDHEFFKMRLRIAK